MAHLVFLLFLFLSVRNSSLPRGNQQASAPIPQELPASKPVPEVLCEGMHDHVESREETENEERRNKRKKRGNRGHLRQASCCPCTIRCVHTYRHRRRQRARATRGRSLYRPPSFSMPRSGEERSACARQKAIDRRGPGSIIKNEKICLSRVFLGWGMVVSRRFFQQSAWWWWR